MTIKTRSQFERFFKNRFIHLRNTIKLDIRQPIGRLKPLVLKDKIVVLHSRKPIPVIYPKYNGKNSLHCIICNLLAFRIDKNVFMSSGFVREVKSRFVIRKNHKRISGIDNYCKRILVCHK